MSSNLSTVIQNNLTGGKWWSAAACVISLYHGKSAKNHEMENWWRSRLKVSRLEENHLDIGSCGKTGKNGRKERKLLCHPGGKYAPYYLGKVRHSLANGAMEKGASASALSSTSGDEIVGSPFLEVRLHTHLFIFYHFYGTESTPRCVA